MFKNDIKLVPIEQHQKTKKTNFMHGQVISNVQATTFLKKFKNFCIKKMKLEFKGTKKIKK